MNLDWLSAYLIFGAFAVCMYIGLALLLHLQMGISGIGNFGIVGFWGLGMYTFGILRGGDAPPGTELIFNPSWAGVSEPWPTLIAMLGAVAACWLAGLFIGWLISDQDSDGVLVGTMGFASVVYLLIRSQKDLSGGDGGIGGLRFPYDVGDTKANELLWLGILAVVVAGLLFYVWRVHRSPYGRLLIALGQNEPLARSLTKPTRRTKIMMFAVTSAGMGLLGGMYAVIIHFLTPWKVGVDVTLAAIVGLVLGGSARVWGAVVGVLLTVGLFDIVIQLYIPFPKEWYEQALPVVKQMVYGGLLILVLMFRPLGVLGDMRRDKLIRRVHGGR